MRRVIARRHFAWLLAAFLTLAGMCSQAYAQSKRLVEVKDGQKITPAQVYGASHALLIGINRYAHVPAGLQLHYAVKDVEDLKRMLIDSYGFKPENITTLTDKEATLAGIRHALSGLANKQKVKSDDRVLVYFSGHGQTVPLPDGGDMGFLIPADAEVDLNDASNVGPYLETCLKMSDVWTTLDASPAKHILMLADACYSGLLATARGGGGLNAASLSVWSNRRARQIVTAGGKGEESLEDPALGHGTFTYQLLEELRARAKEPGAVFTTTELYSALATAVSNQTNAKQTPQLAKYKLEGEFLFISAPKGKASSHELLDKLKLDPKKVKPTEKTKQKAKNTDDSVYDSLKLNTRKDKQKSDKPSG